MKNFGFNRSVIVLWVLVAMGLFYVGCGGGGDSIVPTITGSLETLKTEVTETPGPTFPNFEAEEKYYTDLEKTLNDKLNVPADSPNKCATTGLQSVTLSQTSDEIKTTVSYDLSRITVTANVAGQDPKVVTPVWAVYSALGTLNGTVYTSIAEPKRPYSRPLIPRTAYRSSRYSESGSSGSIRSR